MAERRTEQQNVDEGNAGRPDGHDRPGGEAERPTQIPPKGWMQVLIRAFKDSKSDHVPLMAAGVAFYALVSIFPALIALLTIYGLFADPQQVQQQISQFAGALPQGARGTLTDQLSSIAQSSGGALRIGLIASLAAALWTASSGTMGLIKATNVAYDEEETRGFFRLRGTALLLTLGAIVFVIVALALVAVAPAVLGTLGLGRFAQIAVQIGRWIALILFVMVALAVVYWAAPDRSHPQLRWVSLGAIVATLLWVIASAAFSFYVSNFGSYNETYGALAGVIILLFWLFITSYIVLLGAEINAEAEHQTAADTTTGRPRAMGERQAKKADTLADQP